MFHVCKYHVFVYPKQDSCYFIKCLHNGEYRNGIMDVHILVPGFY